jgi:hypothetical protein
LVLGGYFVHRYKNPSGTGSYEYWTFNARNFSGDFNWRDQFDTAGGGTIIAPTMGIRNLRWSKDARHYGRLCCNWLWYRALGEWT